MVALDNENTKQAAPTMGLIGLCASLIGSAENVIRWLLFFPPKP